MDHLTHGLCLGGGEISDMDDVPLRLDDERSDAQRRRSLVGARRYHHPP